MERRREGQLFAVTGSTRSGKTLWTAQQIARARRVLVWDLLGEWSSRYRCERVTSLAALGARIAANNMPGRVAYWRPGMVDDFDTFCRLAWVWCRQAPGVLVVEELSSVTQPGKAPLPWGDIVRMGLRYGLTIYAITQRPAESDKTTFGNATCIHAGRAAFPNDRAMLAKYLNCPVAEIAALQPLQFIEYWQTGQHIRGRVDPRKAT